MIHVFRDAICNFRRKFLEAFVLGEKILEVKIKLISDDESSSPRVNIIHTHAFL